jgi:protein JSN1
MPQNGFEVGMDMQRTGSMDSNNMPFQSYGIQAPLFPSTNVQVPPMTMQQLQYQQSILARSAASMNNYYPAMQSGFGAFGNATPSDHYRGANPIQPPPQMSPSPMLSQSTFGPPGFGNIGMGMNGYGYGGMAVGGMQGMPYMQQEQVNGRRGRVSLSHLHSCVSITDLDAATMN